MKTCKVRPNYSECVLNNAEYLLLQIGMGIRDYTMIQKMKR